MNDILGIKNGKVVADYHIHFGQFYDVYYQPAFVVGTLAANGVKEAWGSSTTACLRWNTPEGKQYILQHLEDEVKEALYAARKYALNFVPLYRVIPGLHSEGVRVDEFMSGAPYYKGIKIHPMDDGFEDESSVNTLMEEVCEYASVNQFPILIHTGEDACVAPERFERFFGAYGSVKFVLAHCKEAERAVDLFKKYDNVFGDTAFCPHESLSEICRSGFADRMQIGTDFPITHYWGSSAKCGSASKRALASNYKKVVEVFSKWVSDMPYQ